MELVLAPRRGAVGTARRWTGTRARELGATGRVVAVIELLTSELVANAVAHGGAAQILLRVGLVAGALEVAVRDCGEQLPVTRTTGPEVPGGQGMRLVGRLATTWGVRRHDPGKTVWFAVALTPTAAGGP